MHFIIFVLCKFGSNLFGANGIIIVCKSTKFDIEEKSSKFLLEIMTLVSSANNLWSDIEFLHRGCSLTYIMNNRGPRIDSQGTPCLNVPQSERKNKLLSTNIRIMNESTGVNWTFCSLQQIQCYK
jgi:hypothetical protein